MDRVGEITKKINDDWIKLNHELQQLSMVLKSQDLKDLQKQFDELRNQYANLITLGQKETWIFFAEANGVILPNDDEPQVNDA
jgi:hypothetical protein